MSAPAAMGPVCQTIISMLQASPAVTALVPVERITDELPPRSLDPAIVVESQGELPFNTLGPTSGPKWGSEVHVGIRPISQYRSDSEVNAILAAVRTVLDGASLTVPGYPFRELLTWEGSTPILKTSVSGVTTREAVAEYEITVHQ